MDKENNKSVTREKKQKSIWQRGLFVLVSVLVIIVVVVMPISSIYVYELRFGRRYETAKWKTFSVDDFEGLKVEQCTFPSNDGQRLAGYHYYKVEQEIKGVVVIAHGFGIGGHNSYMNLADYFTSNGYWVFTYDITGTDKSQGKGVEGLPQGLIDLDYALQYVKQSSKYNELPILLFGHSWGGFSVASVLNIHPEVKAVAMCAGFDRTTEVFEQQGRDLVGDTVKLFMPYVSLYEQIKFGKYASYSAMDGFENSSAGIMVIHSKDDKTVYTENGYYKFHKKYGSDSRFSFVLYEGRGHTYVYNSEESFDYREKMDTEYEEYVKTHGGEDSDELHAEFIELYYDKDDIFELDNQLMNEIIEFYEMNIG